MTKKITTFFLLAMMLGLYLASSRFRNHPVPLFALRGSADTVEAFKVQVCFGGQATVVEPIVLTEKQRREGGDILSRRNVEQLKEFSKNFGNFFFVMGETGTDERWPLYLGGGLKIFGRIDSNNVFDNLTGLDRFYWAFNTKVPTMTDRGSDGIAAKGVTQNIEVVDLNLNSKPTPEAKQDAGIVRVEILNGCGITNAADWAARRVKGPHVVITDTGNADNFHYAKTVVKTRVGIPVALEEALERLGLTKDYVEEIPAASAQADVIVVIGRDYSELKRAVQ
jgi:hypothetical protein